MSFILSALSLSRPPPPSSSSSSRRRTNSAMESIYSIALGLGVRTVVGFASHNDFKVAGPLIGVWEGVVTLHFLKKMPSSFDPYIAYAVRMFIDFLVTESVSRMVLVIIWTALGMVLADVAPAIWLDVGLHRPWRRLRRDLYTIYKMTPKVPGFPKSSRVVRFSRSRHSIIDTPLTFPEFERGDPKSAPSDTTPPASIIQERTEPTSVTRRRVAPGHYTTGFTTATSDAESARRSSSVRASPVPTVRTRRATVYHEQPSSDIEVESSSSVSFDLDRDNLSSGRSSLASAESTPEHRDDYDLESSIESAPEIDAEEEVAVSVAQQGVAAAAAAAAVVAVMKKDEEERTPRARPMYLPPTPSDSAAKWELSREDHLIIPPPSAFLQQIPDDHRDWDHVTKKEKEVEDKPPPTPAKDDVPLRYRNSSFSQRTPMSQTNSLGLEGPIPEEAIPEGVEDEGVSAAQAAATGAGGLSGEWAEGPSSALPRSPAPVGLLDGARNSGFTDDDDMYLDAETSKLRIDQYMKESGARRSVSTKDYLALLDAPSTIPADSLREEERVKEKLERRRLEKERLENERLAEVAKQLRKAEKAERRRKAEEAKRAEEAELQRKAEEAERQRKFEEAERQRKVEEAERQRKAEEAEKQREAEEAERQRKEEEAEKQRKAAEKAERQRKEEEDALIRRRVAEQLAREEEEKRRKLEEEKRAQEEREAEEKRLAEIEEKKRIAEEEERKRVEEAEAEKKRLEAAEEERKRAEAEAEEDRKRAEAEAEEERKRAEAEEEERRRVAEAEAAAQVEKRRLEELEAEEKRKLVAEEKEKKRQEKEEKKREKEERKARIAAKKAKREAEEKVLEEEAEAERKRVAEEEEAERQRVEAEEAERTRIAEEEAERQRVEEARIAEEAKRLRIEAEEKAERLRIEEAERIRLETEEAERERIAKEAEEQRLAEEVELKRLAEEAEAAKNRLAAEAEAAEEQRLAEEEAGRLLEKARLKKEQEDEAERHHMQAKADLAAAEEARSKKEQEDEVERLRLQAEADIAASAEEARRQEDLEHLKQEQDAAAEGLKRQAELPQAPTEAQDPTDDLTTPIQPAADPGTPTQVTVQLATPTNVHATLDPEQDDADAQGEEDEDDAAAERSELGARAESVATAFTEVSLEVQSRLQKTISRRAQKIELEDRVRQLQKSPNPDAAAIQHAERVLAKFDKKIQKMYEDACRLSVFNERAPKTVVLKVIPVPEAEERVKDALLWHLTPDCRSFRFIVNLPAGKGAAVNRLKAAINSLLRDNLNIEPIPDPNNGKILTIEISEDEFDDWVLDFRQRSVMADD